MNKKNTISNLYCTPYQLKLPLDLSRIIDINDPVYTFSEVVDHIDLSSYFAGKGCRMGRPRCDAVKLLKAILFSFMENGYTSLRQLEKLCKTDIRYMWLIDGMKAPSFMTFGNFINDELCGCIDDIFRDINNRIFELDSVDLSHIYIDGTKINANANKYSWVWKKSCTTNIAKTFLKITDIIKGMNEVLALYGVKIETREEYAIEYAEQILDTFLKTANLDAASFVYGKGKHKTPEQRLCDKMSEYIEKLKGYARHVEICGDHRNSYSKTDPDATFMRVKIDYMGNDQLLPAYNMQIGICDEYIAVVDARQYAADVECFVPLMEKFQKTYGFYPKYPVADAGYGSYNNYLFCEETGMEKFMKFAMYEKHVKDENYRNNPYDSRNFGRDEGGFLICPNGKRFLFRDTRPVRGNKYGRTEEIYECESCDGCSRKSECTRCKGNRLICLNTELTQIHEEVLTNLESIHGALLRMNRSIQAEGAYGILKWDRSYKRAFRRGIESVLLEFTLISCGFNLYKFHNKRNKADICA